MNRTATRSINWHIPDGSVKLPSNYPHNLRKLFSVWRSVLNDTVHMNQFDVVAKWKSELELRMWKLLERIKESREPWALKMVGPPWAVKKVGPPVSIPSRSGNRTGCTACGGNLDDIWSQCKNKRMPKAGMKWVEVNFERRLCKPKSFSMGTKQAGHGRRSIPPEACLQSWSRYRISGI